MDKGSEVIVGRGIQEATSHSVIVMGKELTILVFMFLFYCCFFKQKH